MIAENKQYDEVFDKNIDSDTAEEADKELEYNNVIDTEEVNNKAKKINSEITEFQVDDEVLDNVAVHSTINTELTTTESLEIEMT